MRGMRGMHGMHSMHSMHGVSSYPMIAPFRLAIVADFENTMTEEEKEINREKTRGKQEKMVR